jgi:hypothetical protein
MANKVTEADWEANKSRILDLYILQGRPLRGDGGVIREMERRGFTAT